MVEDGFPAVLSPRHKVGVSMNSWLVLLALTFGAMALVSLGLLALWLKGEIGNSDHG